MNKMKNIKTYICAVSLLVALSCGDAFAQQKGGEDAPVKVEAKADTAISTVADSVKGEVIDDALLGDAEESVLDSALVADANAGTYTQLKKKFIEGGAGFMSLVALALVLGLAICIERIIYLSMSEIDAKKFMAELEKKLKEEGVEAAKSLCRDTRGPVASICYQGLLRIRETKAAIERSVESYAQVQIGNMEKGCSWITLLIAMAPSLGFLGTVIGMVMAFDRIQMAGDIRPDVVASGMKVALITTIFGIITALILNYVLSKIDHLTAQMEESAITLMDILTSLDEEKSKVNEKVLFENREVVGRKEVVFRTYLACSAVFTYGSYRSLLCSYCSISWDTICQPCGMSVISRHFSQTLLWGLCCFFSLVLLWWRVFQSGILFIQIILQR